MESVKTSTTIDMDRRERLVVLAVESGLKGNLILETAQKWEGYIIDGVARRT